MVILPSSTISILRQARSILHTTVWVWLAPLLGIIIILITIAISYYFSCCYANKLDKKQTHSNLQAMRLPVTITTSDHKTTIQSNDTTSIQNPIPLVTPQNDVSNNQQKNDVSIENGITEELKQLPV